jgi:hypothetical protein
VPRLRAIFETSEGVPTAVQGEKYKHYSIMLSLLDVPEDVMAVIYQLDDTYSNPLRMVTKGVPNFQESITSYGDYPVRVAYRPLQDPNRLEQLLSQKLSDALIESYGPEMTDSIRLAIKDIVEH